MDTPPRLVSASAFAIAVAGGLSLAVAMGIGRFAFTPMLPLMMRSGEIDVGVGGWVAAANYLGYLIGAMTASRVPLTPKWLAVSSLVLTAALTSAMSISGPPWAWIALRLLAGVCSAWAFVSTSVWCLGALAQRGRPALSGAVYCGVGAGIAAAGLYCLIAAVVGVSASSLWIQLGFIALVLTSAAVAILRAVPAQLIVHAPTDSGPEHAKGTTGLVICYGALGFGYILPATFLPVLARAIVGEGAMFGLAWPVFGLMAAVSTLAAASVSRRASRLSVWAVSHAIMGVGVLLPSLWRSGVAVAISALLVGGTFMVVTMAGIQEIRARAVGDPTRMVARMTAAFALGQIAGPVCSSLLLHVPAFAQSGLNIALQVAAAALALSAAWLWGQRRPGDARISVGQLETDRETARTAGH